MASSRHIKTIRSHVDKLTTLDDKLLLLDDPAVVQQEEQRPALKEHRQQQCRTWRVCVAILAISMAANMTLGCVILLGFSSPKNNDEGRDDVINGDLSTSICMSCESLNVPDPEHAPFMSKVKVIGHNLCCLNHSEHLHMLLEIVVSEHYHFTERGDNPETFQLDLTSPSAHLYLQNSNTPAEHLQWDPDLGLGTAHTSGGVVYSNGSLRVPEDGVYFLYSHITFRHAQSGSDLHLDHDLIHCMKRFNPDMSSVGNQLLLINKMTTGGNLQRTSYLGANLRLRRGDKVFVDVSDQSVIYDFSPANFFGLYLLN